MWYICFFCLSLSVLRVRLNNKACTTNHWTQLKRRFFFVWRIPAFLRPSICALLHIARCGLSQKHTQKFTVKTHSWFCAVWEWIFIPAKAREYVFTGVGLCACVCVCLSVTAITKNVDGFAPNFMRRFLREKEDQVCVSLRSVEGCGSNGQ